jgi:hypothetical protein
MLNFTARIPSNALKNRLVLILPSIPRARILLDRFDRLGSAYLRLHGNVCGPHRGPIGAVAVLD